MGTQYTPTLALIEDDGPMRTFLTLNLGAKYNMQRYKSVEDFLEHRRERSNPDLIVSDFHMDELTAIDLIRHIRLVSDIAHTPILIISGDDDPSWRTQCLEAGANDCVSKPFDPIEISLRVKRLLDSENTTAVTL